MSVKAREILYKYYGYSDFRKGQSEIIESIVDGKDVLAIMPTGGGKSICYQVPALILDGVTIVISPLISLMKDQVDALNSVNVPSAFINSTLSTREYRMILQGMQANEYKLIYVAPERLDSQDFLDIIKTIKVSQVAVDEAHCVSQWGHDFRSSYKRIPAFIKSLACNPIVSAFTATASSEVQEDIVKLLELKNPSLFCSSVDRENLSIHILKPQDPKKYLLNYVDRKKGSSGIVYCATRNEVDSIYDTLLNRGISVVRYHAGMSEQERSISQEKFVKDDVSVIVATNAFGMGIDKPDIRWVLNFNMPQSIENYYQEIGRAGRDGELSECVMLFSPGDVVTHKYLIDVNNLNPSRAKVQHQKLKQITDLVHGDGCYRKGILNYFGEDAVDKCNNCSSCMNDNELVDKTLEAQKILSCIYRMQRGYGSKMVVDVLRGSKNKKVIELGLNALSTYGLMSELSSDEVRDIINKMLSAKILDSTDGKFPVLRLNEVSMEVMRGNHKFLVKEDAPVVSSEEDNALFEELKLLRKSIADKEGVAPYIVLSDASLKGMATTYPLNKSDFIKIQGMSEFKYEKYGDIFKGKISDFIKVNNIKIREKKNSSTGVLEVVTDLELYELLYKLRADICQRDNMYPPMFMHKNTLKEISARYPMNINELKDINGLGEVKVTQYGKEILAVIKDYVELKNIGLEWVDKGKSKLIIDGEDRKPNEISIAMLKENVEIEEVSKELEVPVSTILGYIADYLKENKLDFNIDASSFYSESEKLEIVSICEEIGHDKVKEIKLRMPRETRYEAIRAVILDKYYLNR